MCKYYTRYTLLKLFLYERRCNGMLLVHFFEFSVHIKNVHYTTVIITHLRGRRFIFSYILCER